MQDLDYIPCSHGGQIDVTDVECISLKLFKKGKHCSNLAELFKEDKGRQDLQNRVVKAREDKDERTASGQDTLFLKRI